MVTRFYNIISNLLSRLEANRPFSEPQAWTLFRTAALAEAFGWTVLIIGIIWQHTHLPGNTAAVPIAGQIHGTIFLAYFGVLIATYTSLLWSRPKLVLALIAGVPPYGTLAFELWAATVRRNQISQRHFRSITFQILASQLIT